MQSNDRDCNNGQAFNPKTAIEVKDWGLLRN
jgi:hypothetical protein